MSGVYNNSEFKKTVKIKFSALKNVREFASLLNFVEQEVFNSTQELYPITFSHLYFISKTKEIRYLKFHISKKNGGLREIKTPDKVLMRIQNLINIVLQIIFEESAHYCSNGFIIGRDIKRNALPHVSKKFVLNLDIENFFPSINFRRVKTVLELSPFSLCEHREKVAFLMANLLTHNDSLPQGAPTSPIVSNIVTQNLDRKISKFCIQNGVKYSRYADDLSFSCNRAVLDEDFITELSKIINSENFKLNDEKTRIRNQAQSQEVTGLIVNRKVNVSRDYLQKTRAMLNNWEKGGLDFAISVFKQHQPLNRQSYNFKNVLRGQLAYITLIKGKDNLMAKNLRKKYLFLDNLINYEFLKEKTLKTRLQVDNRKMEMIYFEGNRNNDDNFISFCTCAFHQIENMINYLYWKKFKNFDDLLIELLTKNPNFSKRYKNNLEKAKSSFSQINRLNINVLVFLYEKDFFFDKGIFYDKHLTMLREIRNDESHRCSVINVDKDKIQNEYKNLQEKGEDNKIKKEVRERIELNYKVLLFLEEKNYNKVRTDLKNLVMNIQKYFE
ncbi:reverse transcriptase family protein [Flavobacterium agricola]|uniref:RNA-directed DNA polymerase n=1 Tax=Flavobacterium agricola TaxID=2870839 RepID=A0ABY6LZR6_9FLAO|nr:reverse transcriptase family protein [Flavobacterium agricola]UYW01781.1 reverse transcriptase family protein [Flavobacterium agricola]